MIRRAARAVPAVDPASDAYARATGRLVPLAPAVLGALLASMSLAHLASVQDVVGSFLALASGTLGVTVCVAAFVLRRRRPTGHRAHAVLALCLVLAALDALVAQRASGGLERSADLVLVVAGGCAVLLDRRWLVGTLALLLGIWGAAALTGPVATLPYAVFTMLVAGAGGLSMRRVRLTALAEVEALETEVETLEGELETLGGRVAALETRASLAVLDPLTGLPDRRGLQLVGQHLVAIARREGGAVGCTFVGIDGMAAVHTWGGAEGVDTLVRHVCGITRSVVRATDVVGRWREGMLVVVTHGQGAPMDVLEQRIAAKLAQDCPIPPEVWPRRLVLGRAVMHPWDDGGLVTLLTAAERDIHANLGTPAPAPTAEARAEAAAAFGRQAEAVVGEGVNQVVAQAWRTVSAQATSAAP
ncbi:MAG: diguanylate cyclase [Actinobacteria bacterium]|nr:diguanylate cyclase [Actinomycetota bacterium]